MFENHVLPLVDKLEKSEAFFATSDAYVEAANKNRDEWIGGFGEELIGKWKLNEILGHDA